MEKRDPNAPIRAFSLVAGRFGLQRFLLGMLFVPFLLTVSAVLEPRTEDSPQPIVHRVKPPLRELVRIYSIVKSNRPDIGEREAWELTDVIHAECGKHDLDPMLVLALIDVESKFQYAAVSPAGARGLMQILPYVAKSLLQEIGLGHESESKKFKPEALDDPILNIKIGVYYLQDLKKSFRNLTLALTAYNLGPTETKNRLDNDIEVSEAYATAVLSTYQKYQKARPPIF